MSDTFKPISDDVSNPSFSSADSYLKDDPSSGEAGRTLLAAVLGGVVSAAGYLVYTRLPDDQKDKLHAHVRTLVESRVNELRGRFNI